MQFLEPKRGALSCILTTYYVAFIYTDHFLSKKISFFLWLCYASRMMKDRVHKLEEALAHQDQQISDLSEMLILQGREISKLERDIKKLNAKIDLYETDMEESGEDGKPLSASEFAAQNKPPHW